MFVVNFINFSVASAETEIIEAEGSYTADYDMNEPLSTITEHAREDARRRAAEKAALFVESHVEIKNNQVTKDRVRTYAATIMNVLEEEFRNVSDKQSMTLFCKIKVEVDSSKINLQELLGKEIQLERFEEQNKIIQEKDAEIAKWKLLYEQSNSEKQKIEIKNQINKSQQQFLVAKYERDLDLFDLNSSVDWKNILPTAEKLQEIEPLNATAFRATIYAYREQGDLKKSVDYCKRFLNANAPADTEIEAYAQLGDIYLNEFDDKTNAKIFVDKGINLVKKNYSATMIEKFVNGTNFQVSEFIPTGKTNTIRELYILKSDIENILPAFKEKSVVEDMLLVEDKIYDIKYKTDW